MGSFKQFVTEAENIHESRKDYDNDIAYLYQQDKPLLSIQQEVEAIYGPVSLGELYRSLKRTGVAPNRRSNPYKGDVSYFDQSGFGLEEISKLTGYSTRHVRNILKSHKEQIPTDDNLRD